MRLNHNGAPLVEEEMFQPWSPSPSMRDMEETMKLMLDYFHLEVWRTNATKHGLTILEIREVQ